MKISRNHQITVLGKVSTSTFGAPGTGGERFCPVAWGGGENVAPGK